MLDPELGDADNMPDPVGFLSLDWQERICELTSYVDLWDRLSEIARDLDTQNPSASNALVTPAKAASLRFSEADTD